MAASKAASSPSRRTLPKTEAGAGVAARLRDGLAAGTAAGSARGPSSGGGGTPLGSPETPLQSTNPSATPTVKSNMPDALAFIIHNS